MISAAPVLVPVAGLIMGMSHMHDQIALLALCLIQQMVFWAAIYLIGVEVMPELLARNVPFVLIYVVIWLVNAVLLLGLHLLFLQHTGGSTTHLHGWYFQQQAVLLLVMLLQLRLFESDVRAALSACPQLVPIWAPVRLSQELQLSAALIDPTLGGTLRSLNAQNQYVLVTTTTETRLLRTSLKDAESCLSPTAGLRIHRSWWLSCHELADCVPIAGENALKHESGACYPVGRNYRQQVRAMVESLRRLNGTPAVNPVPLAPDDPR